ncbi:unnamed protein product [Calicophoron daubneyi]|uniref:Uncharacterized protein n=1 Tax=Calicophoron daubneyi TaxID=300641 RepID=A0AAV2T6C6_CALDB
MEMFYTGIFLLSLLSGLQADPLTLIQHGNNVIVHWDESEEPISEYVLSWYQADSGIMLGNKFLKRSFNGYVVRNLAECIPYRFTLTGLDWKYREKKQMSGEITIGELVCVQQIKTDSPLPSPRATQETADVYALKMVRVKVLRPLDNCCVSSQFYKSDFSNRI